MKIIEDIKAYSGKSFFKGIYTVLLNSNFQMTFWYRVAHLFYLIHLSLVSKIIMYFHKLIFSCDIDYRCQIGGGLKIVHGLGIVIGKDVNIGANCSIYKGCVLGGNGDKSKEFNGRIVTQPQVGNNVSIYSNATILGPVIIGDNSSVGAAAVIMHDVNSNTTVFMKSERCEIIHDSN